jgi:hypothetical protein
MFPFPSHGSGKLDDSIDRIEHGTIPVLFQTAPASLDGIVFAMVWWIIGKTYVG